MKQQPELAPALQMSRRRDVNDCLFFGKGYQPHALTRLYCDKEPRRSIRSDLQSVKNTR